jgi:hypothetical protein
VQETTGKTHKACGNAHEEKLSYLRRFQCKKLLIVDERVSEWLVYSRFFDIQAGDRSASGVDGLFAALDDKRPEVNLRAAAKAHVSAQFKQQPIRGGKPSQGNKGDRPPRGKPKDKGLAPIKGIPEAKPDKPKARPYPKAEIEPRT